MTEPIRIGTRGSQLALWQANHVAGILRGRGHRVEIEIVRTTGDRMQQPGFVVPPGMDGKGIFIKEIEEALAAGRIDLAVHSLKDLPTELDERFCVAAIPPRADARDAWVCEPYWALHTLPYRGRVGTTSPRRRAQLLALRPDLQFVELRGNVDTRLRKLEAGECDALVLACAGLDRLGRTEWVHQRFAVDELTPAPGQGALALETRSPNHALDTDDAGRDPAIAFDDWPPPGPQDYAAGFDPAIQEALKAEHPNWRSGIEQVLRGWAEARAQTTDRPAVSHDGPPEIQTE